MKSLILILTIFMAAQSNAASIFGNHTTNGGKSVNLQGLEWLTFDEIKHTSRFEVEAGYGGFINTTVDTWRYASNQETANLLQSVWGGTHIDWHASNYDGANWLYENFGTSYGNSAARFASFHYGDDGGCHPLDYFSCYGYYNSGNYNGVGRLSNDYGLSTVGYQVIIHKSASHDFGHLLVREKQQNVPEPTAMLLTALGLFGFGMVKRHKSGK